jgi:hypothetical protein
MTSSAVLEIDLNTSGSRRTQPVARVPQPNDAGRRPRRASRVDQQASAWIRSTSRLSIPGPRRARDLLKTGIDNR